MKRLIISLVVLAVLTTMAIPVYSKGKGGSNLKVIDANGLRLGKVVGAGFAGEEARVATTIGGEFVILNVARDFVSGTRLSVFFKLFDCAGQGFISPSLDLLMLNAVVGVDNSVYKVLDRDPALLESFRVKSRLNSGVACANTAFDAINQLPATRLGDLSEFTLHFEYLE